MYSLYRPSRTYIQKHYKAISLAILTIVFTGAAFFSHASYASVSNTRADAWGTLEVSGSNSTNMGGAGVDVYSNGKDAFYTPNKPNNSVGNIVSGEKWQCVEFVNRLYLTKGWISKNWAGNGGDLYANRANVGLTGEANGSITSLDAGDEVSYNVTTVPEGHTAIVSSVSGSSVTFINQNTVQVFNSGTLSNKTLTVTWSGYTVTGVVHHPAGGTTPSSGNVVPIPTSDGHIQTITTTDTGLKANWYSPADGTTGGWIPSLGMPSAPTGTPAAVLRTGTGENKIDIFVRGSNGSIYQTWYDFQQGTWGGWINLGGNLASNPQAVATSDGHYQIFATGSNLLQQMWFAPNGTHAGGWTTSAGMAGSSPVSSPALVVRPGDVKVDAFVRAANNQIYVTWYSFGVGDWGGWSPMGGTVSSDPQAVATSDGHYQVFGTGNNVIQQKWLEPVYGGQGGNWTTSPALGSLAAGTPAIAPRSGQNVLDAYVYGSSNNQVYHNWYSFQTGLWSGWSGMGGNANNLRTVLTPTDGHDQVFGTGNNLVQQNWFAQDGTSGAWKSF